MNNRTFKYVLIAVGAAASIAFYVAGGNITVSDAGGSVIFMDDGASQTADTDRGGGSADPDAARAYGGSDQADYGVQPDEGSVTFTDEQQETIDLIVRNAVREELVSICEEGYLETALEEAAQYAASEAEARKDMVNINTASLNELTALSGIGETRAAEIIAYREASGGFSSIEEIMNVSGIGESIYGKLKDKIYVQ